MLPLRFVYQDAKGESRDWMLIRRFENTRYIQGRTVTDSPPRTFRKDRIQAYLEGYDHLLLDQAPPAPGRPSKRNSTPGLRFFPGFKAADCAYLAVMAMGYGFRVVTAVTNLLTPTIRQAKALNYMKQHVFTVVDS
ncbi:hypothetical protein FBY21_1660 [Pseudomonas sp. SLBN-26]|uniref:hypothetical protein n=1 Tax=Pseudomonadaceae TaxID=135621 RepID=UPI0011510C11|nr:MULTISPECIES: hypothetical protein [Pseudomonas]MCP1617059.1 hypothetical protein [Pseudomonas otitidis]TQL06302.1 hypothetical protein FBY21_1660 [Pseudomonas sp. SLBN-26]